jgi:subtilisin-like proprotein convertase family protein
MYASAVVLAATSAALGSNAVRISQVYGGGNNSSAPYNADFVELYNSGATAVDIGGYALTYTSATGTFGGGQFSFPAGTKIGANSYVLVQMNAAGATGAALRADYYSATAIDMSATAGNVALLTAAQSGTTNTCASLTATLVDKVGYGTTANCFEGTSFAPAPSNTTAVIRKANGATDSDVNSADFYAATPAPRNSLTRVNYLAQPASSPSADGWTQAVTGTASGSVGSSDISTVSWSLTANAGSTNSITETRTVSAGAGKTISVHFDGNAAAAPAAGCSTGIEFRSGANVALSFKLENGTSFWKVVDSAGTTTSTLAPIAGAITISLEIRGSGAYVLTANAYSRSGTLASSSTVIDALRVFNTGIATAVNFNNVAVADSIVTVTAAPGSTTIPDNNSTGISASLVVSAAQAPTTTRVRDIRARMTVTHPKAGDVSLSVVAPDTTVGYLVNRIVATSNSANYAGTYLFADSYPASFSSAVTAAGTGNIAVGNYFPTNNTAGTASDLGGRFASKTVNGTWKLTAADNASGNNSSGGTFTNGTLEIWLGTDTDGDGTLDEFDGCPSNGSYTSPATWYEDSDGDTYGNSAATQQACSQPAGYVANSTDCNDSNSAINPGATEVCDGVDNNCTGGIDDGVTTTFYRDLDGDGYGAATPTVQACSVPVGYAATNTDCNDASADVKPGAVEICDGVDQDCDGAFDDGFADVDGDTIGDCVDTGWTSSLASVAIQDATSATPNVPGVTNRTFVVPASQFPSGISNVRVTLGLTHTFIGDLKIELIAPNGTTALIMSQPGKGTGTGNLFTYGYSGGLSGTYIFDDSFTGNLWTTAALVADANTLAAGNYFASNATGAKVNLSAAFATVAAAGTWTLRITDNTNQDTGTLNSARIELTRDSDADGDGVGDFADACDENPALSAPVTYYRDADSDGYGTSVGTSICETSVPAGYVTLGTDCNDAVATTYPGATEICDGVDQDCDAVPDDGFSDTDGDGIGDCVDSSQSIDRTVTSNSTVPDNNATGLSLTFAVPAGSNGAGLSAVTVAFTVTAAHSNVGQLTATLTAPNGAVATVFAAPGGAADSSNLRVGTWTFADSASITLYAHALATANVDMTAGTYAASNSAGTKVLMNTVFADVTVGGNWVLKIVDGLATSTVTIGTGTLTLAPKVDRDGDGTTDTTDGCPDNAALTTAATYYVDADGDGYGTTSTGTFCSSTAPAGYSSVNTDCNDSNAAIKPTATELCDLVDNNCDGAIDEGVKTTYYRDADGDGYGTAGTTTLGCSAPTGYVVSGTDCNDANSAIRPSAAEICDGIDQDCDGAYDNGFADADGDTIGDCADTGGWTGLLAGGTIPDNGFEFLRTNGSPYASLVSYASLTNLRTNASGSTAATLSPTIKISDALVTDGKYFYKVTNSAAGVAGSYNDQIIRYASLANLAANVGGVTFTMNGYGMYFDDDIIADGATGRFFRTTRNGASNTVTVGMFAYNTFADLIANNSFYAAGFVDNAVAFDSKFWSVDGKFYRTNVTGTTGATTVTGINTYNSSADLYNNVIASTSAVTATYAGSVRFLSSSSTGAAAPGVLERTFTVPAGQITAGISGAFLGLDITHGYIGDLTVQLTAPNGTVANVLVRPGKGTGTSATTGATYNQYLNGYASNVFGIYYFDDEYANSVWTAASALATDAVVPAGDYFASSSDGTKVLLDSAFSGLTPAQIVGTWTLRITDSSNGDIGSLVRARVELYKVADADGDGTGDASDGCPNNASLTAAQRFYIDVDADSYGAAGTFQDACQTSAPAGYVSDSTDCNDANANIKPGAVELCSDATVDNNCNGTATDVDDAAADKATFFRDVDGDGYGILGTTSRACAAPTGYVANSTDCNDSSAAIKPDAAELCADTGVDNNCNGSTSDVDADAADKGTYFRDADGDGYGTAGDTSRACSMPGGFASNGADCDDGSSAVKPGAAELCADSTVDNNCDGTTTGVDANAYDKVVFFADADGDGFTLASGANFCSGTTNVGYVAAASASVDCDDANAAVKPGAAELCADATVDNNCDGTATDVDAAAADKVAFFADADGDSYTLASGANFCSGTTNAGYVAAASASVDCDDTNAAVKPGAAELCADSTVDNNCDGTATDVDAAAADKVAFFADADSDTYGDAAASSKACSQPAGTVTNSTDCNDGSAAIKPGAPELCADSTVDNNCNGNAIEVDTGAADKVDFFTDADGDGFSATSSSRFCSGTVNPGYLSTQSSPADCDDARSAVHALLSVFVDIDGDSYGSTIPASICEVAPTTGFSLNDTDCNDTVAAIRPGATEVCNEVDDNCVGGIDEGVKTTFYGDSDGDGAGDASSTTDACSAPAGYVANSNDQCPSNSALVKQATYYLDADSDGSGDAGSASSSCSSTPPSGYVASSGDSCPNDATKLAPGACGCGAAETDSDGDATPNCIDSCPNDSSKTAPGACGCGSPDTDANSDGTADCTTITPAMGMAVLIDSDLPPFSPGEMFRVRVSYTTPGRVISQARLSLAYDKTAVMPVTITPVAGSPFSTEITETIDTAAGTIRYVVGSTYGTGSMAATADITFVAIDGAALCGDVGTLVWFTTINSQATTLLSVGGDALGVTSTPLDKIRVDGTGPVLSGVPANQSLSCDAGSIVGAVVLEPEVVSTDACEGDRPVTLAISYPGSSTPVNVWPASDIFPIGVTTVVFESADTLGNKSSESRTITVLDQQLADITFALDGVVAGNSTRDIRVTVGPTTTILSVSFIGKVGIATGVILPTAATQDCITVKDVYHSIARSGSPIASGARYTLAVSLVQGDSNDDNMVDIVDFAYFVAARGTTVTTNHPANFNADVAVNNADLSFISVNFFQIGESCSGFTTGHPLARISVKELRRVDLHVLTIADLTGDGWIDSADVAEYLAHGMPNDRPLDNQVGPVGPIQPVIGATR